jgi:hypothetical protein
MPFFGNVVADRDRRGNRRQYALPQTFSHEQIVGPALSIADHDQAAAAWGKSSVLFCLGGKGSHKCCQKWKSPN